VAKTVAPPLDAPKAGPSVVLRRVPSQPPVQQPHPRRPPGATGGNGWFRQLSGLFQNGTEGAAVAASPSSDGESEGEEESEEEESEEGEEEKEPERMGSWLAGVFGSNGPAGAAQAAPPTTDASEESSEGAPTSWLASLSSRVTGVTLPADQSGPAERLAGTLCSWCFRGDAGQRLVRSAWLVRPHYQCEECGKSTVGCFGCADGMARCYGESADKMCYRCTGLYDRVEGRVGALNSTGRRCSWCRAVCTQALHRTAAVGADPRDLYLCEGCGGFAVRCEKCPQFARATEAWRDATCAVCSGTASSWDPAAQGSEAHRLAPCSWCLTVARHERLTRGLLFRAGHRCLACQNPTAECRSCKSAMARGTEGACAACQLQRTWEALQQQKQAAFGGEARWTISTGIQQMGRASSEKAAALAAGLVRPFLLLCSMRPALRAQVGTVLGAPLLGTPAFGDAHREALALLSGPRGLAGQGAVGRVAMPLVGAVLGGGSEAAPASSWYHVARRAVDRTFGGQARVLLPPERALSACRDPEDTTQAKLEREVLARVARFCLETGRIRGTDFQREDKEGLHLVLGHYLGAETGSEEDRAVLQYAWRVVAAARARTAEAQQQPQAQPAEPQKPAQKPFPVPAELAPLFNAVIIILNQRILLASEGVQIESYYTNHALGAGD
jgi:hypothetical protein